MPTITHIMNYQELYDAIQATGTWDTIAQAVEQGAVYVENGQATNGLTYIQGGAGTPVIELGKTALETAKDPNIIAKAWSVGTAAVTAAIKGGKVALMGLATMEVPTAVAVASPLAGLVIGEELWRSNPSLWTKISQAALPYCYEENKIRAFVDFTLDAAGKITPIMLIETALIDKLRELFSKEVNVSEISVVTANDGASMAGSSLFAGQIVTIGTEQVEITEIVNGGFIGYGYISPQNPNQWGYISVGNGNYVAKRKSDGGFISIISAGSGISPFEDIPFPKNGITGEEALRILREAAETEVIPATAGVSAPTVPVEPIVWPDTPIIVVPDPLGPDYQPIPVTPVTPLPLPTPEPIPQLPEHVPDPTPEEEPENWPGEEPWPSIAPFPYPDPVPSTEPGPDPDWPEVIPWPLPANPPEEWPEDPPENWPTYPPSWPEEYPEELPWPSTPDNWPETVPWPDDPPEWWPETTPWPDEPEEWPDTVPWPVPPKWPVPWPPYWPYPIPFPYPEPSQDPYPDPEKIDDPEKQVDPYIDPWPREWPDPYPYPKPDPDPDPTRDPTQPEPKPIPEPEPGPGEDPYPKPEPVDPSPPTPPEGTIEPPVPPIIPLPFSTTTGLISVYHPTQAELLDFANWLWVTWQDATIEKIWNNPFDGVITLFELYCTPTDVGRKNIRSGFLDSQVNSAIISRYTEIDCGSIGVPEYFGNYLDYAPYSKCHIYLPFIGIVELNVDDIVGHGVNVTYKIDEYNGSCVAMITVAKSTDVNGVSVDYSNIMYQFSGNCAVELPLAGGSQAAIKAGMLEAAAWGIGSVIGGVMSGNALGDIGANLAYGAASAVHSVVSAKSSVQHSGSFGSSYGAMGCKKPFIIVTRPKQIQVPNYNELYGYQAHKMVRVGDCTGYLRCREVHVISPTASDEEKAQIEQLMKTGVYVTE